MKVVIILPTYNERENVQTLLKLLWKIFDSLPIKFDTHILVVDDHSPDGTALVIKQIMKQRTNLHLIEKEKHGLGAAYVKGMNHAVNHLNADILVEMDADLQHDPNLLPLLLQEIDRGSDFVIGSRYIPGGSIPKNWGISRKIYSIVGNLIVRLGLMILSIHDWTSGYRAVRSSVFKKIGEGLSKFPGYTFQIAFLHRAYQAHFVVSEVPLNFVDRTWGKSKIIPPEYIANIILFIINNSSFLRYLFVGGTGFLLQILLSTLLVHMGFFPGLAVIIGAEIAIVSNFIFNNFWTFAHKRLVGKKKILAKFSAFQLTSIGAVIIQGLTVSLFTLLLGKNMWFIVMVLSILLLVIPYNFIIYNKFIWNTHES